MACRRTDKRHSAHSALELNESGRPRTSTRAAQVVHGPSSEAHCWRRCRRLEYAHLPPQTFRFAVEAQLQLDVRRAQDLRYVQIERTAEARAPHERSRA